MNLEDRIDEFIQAEAFITLKDHKENFPDKIQCRLLNPAKTNIGKISKKILEDIIHKVRASTLFNQWTKTADVIKWFKSIKNKSLYTFFKFDVVAFYPSISENLFNRVLNWADTITPIEKDNRNILHHARESFLFSNDAAWVKKTPNNFDVPMGAFDGAEVCELVGLYLLKLMEVYIARVYVGLYRDDGLAVIKASGPGADRLRKNITKVFKDQGLKLTVETLLTKTDFLDVHFDLQKEIYKPFKKTNQETKYVSIKSNHPQIILKQLPKMIYHRLSNLSSSEEVLKDVIKPYDEAIKKAGYETNFLYTRETSSGVTKNRKRTRNVVWFNPPFSRTTATNVGAKFLRLIDKHFPVGSPLRKIVNRSTVKVSYSTLPNIEQIISSHNKRILLDTRTNAANCNCRVGSLCPVDNKCNESSIIYKAIVTPQTINNQSDIPAQAEYIGLSSNTFKIRYNNHISNFRQERAKLSTSLSSFIWNLKSKQVAYKIDWSIVNKAATYHPSSRHCPLCVLEKTLILMSDHKYPLNKRSEIMSKCRHREKFLLKNYV